VAQNQITRTGQPISKSGDASGIPANLEAKGRELALAEGIPIQGLTVLGGKFYVNTTGLDAKIDKMKEEGVILKESYVQWHQKATREKMEAGAEGFVILFDKAGFLEALQALGGNVSETVIKELKEVFTRKFHDDGWASPENVSLPAIKGSPGYLTMMASRRATNRAKRLASGCGLTSVEEINTAEMSVEEARAVQADIVNDVERAANDGVIDAEAVTVNEATPEIQELLNKLQAKGLTPGKMRVWEARVTSWSEDKLVEAMRKELNV